MNPIALAFSITVPLAFTAGVVFHKYVVSEAEKIKAHVDAAEARIRGEVKVGIEKAVGKI